ncbi:hypothetical protein DFP74_1809 [Nocardiopsis sp. Huas11]|uniref:hypothetical protein n=1 Tax=Nocardiopsis sp. Huas11 TaxID=2183912 RepID=UPI000F1A266C|nr:hypothetical protein [Nocardiopsis sp. Huas11]RKS06185.1 hypothetical protein DFP74_1809 [Nocardiopsis sp. Huas11]
MAKRGPEAIGPEVPRTDDLTDWREETVVLGCHGGAGTTTLRVLLKTPWDLGAYDAERGEIGTFGRPLVLTCRDSVAGTARAAEVINVLERNGLRPAALVVVADGSGPEPSESRARLRLVRDRVGHLVRFPFVPSLRYVDAVDADRVKLPAKARRALEEIRKACLSAATETLSQQGAG